MRLGVAHVGRLLFQPDQAIICFVQGVDNFIELALYRGFLPVLGMLNEHHENRRRERTDGIDNELVRIAKPKNESPQEPEGNEDKRREKRPD